MRMHDANTFTWLLLNPPALLSLHTYKNLTEPTLPDQSRAWCRRHMAFMQMCSHLMQGVFTPPT